MTLRRRATLAAATLAAVAVPRPAAADWREASTDHFLIYADSGEKWLTGFADRLEKLAGALRVLRPQADHDGERANRVVIYAVSGMDAVQKLCGKCGSVAGFYIPRVGHSVAYSARADRATSELDMTSDIVLQHEYSHHFMFSTTQAAYPRWYSEGFAEFFSTVTIGRDGAIEIGRAAKHRAYNIVNANMKIERLLDPPAKMDDLETDIFYGRAWMLTHMLMFDRARSGQVERYLALISGGKTSMEAARGAFGDLAALQRQLNGYVSKPLTYARLPGDRVKAGPVTVRLLTAGEAAMMPVRLKSDRGVSREQALAIVPDARRRATPFANDAGAQAVLAEAEYDAGNDAEADAAADRAIAADPKNVEALLYKGRVAVRRAAEAKADARAWSAARAWYLKANRVDTNAAEPLLLFYTSFGAERRPATPNAALGLYRAFELSPQDPGLRLLAAHQFIIDGRLKDARGALLPIAYDPHGRGDGNFAERIVKMIDAGATKETILGAGSASADKVDAADQK